MTHELLPARIMTSEPGSFARHTVVVRQPQILARLLDENGYPADIRRALTALREEIAGETVRPLVEHARDVASWNTLVADRGAASWQDAAWYLAEAYFYRRVLEAVHYFQPGPWRGVDPFGDQKRRQEHLAVAEFAKVWGEVEAADPTVALEALLHSSLWGNRADLSHVSISHRAQGGLLVSEERHNILIDDTVAARALLTRDLRRVDFVNDNVGMEVLFDLALAEFLLVRGHVGTIVFHLKDRPFFVSDAMPADVHQVVDHLQVAPDCPSRELGARLSSHLLDATLLLTEDSFWASGHMYRELPPRIGSELAKSDLVVLKGDVNYRRLLDDRHWPHTTPIERCAGYFPAPFLLLRTLKGEIMVGLAPGQAEDLSSEDPAWLTNGKRGIVQLVAG